MDILEKVYNELLLIEEREARGATAAEISCLLGIERSNASRYLNRLWSEKRVLKQMGRPVIFEINSNAAVGNDKNKALEKSLESIIGAKGSLDVSIQQAKAAMLYPPKGLHTLILGETGVGKSMFAELMYNYAVDAGTLQPKAPFVRFNCADYADNPQLIMAQIFGVKKGTYTGADRDREGLLKVAHKGILFLDEIHRLPPQGQEILFTYLDKGSFRPLGETEVYLNPSVQIIAATTEDPGSHLLKTFARRIPMTITLPPLKDRGFHERIKLIELFIREESLRVAQSIYITKDSLVSFLLYQCPGNIGQLRSDIQLSCAKAFLYYKSKIEKNIIITQSVLPRNVKKGSFSLKEYRKDINDVLKGKGDLIKYHHNVDIEVSWEEESCEGDFYDVIEKRLESFMEAGKDRDEVNKMLNIEIERHFQNKIGYLPVVKSKKEITKVIKPEILDISKEIMDYASKRLGRKYNESIYLALSLHLQNCIERIKKGGKIYHPKLNLVRVNYPDEFLTAMETAKIIDSKFKIATPLDEIGYMAMILASNPDNYDKEEERKVGILVIMHGDSTALSMTQAANSLAGLNHAVGLDMPLSMKGNIFYEKVKEQVLKIDEGKGVLILADMGSFLSYGDMIHEETGIIIKTVDMVTTSMVMEACIKAAMGKGIDEISQFCIELGKRKTNKVRQSKETKKNMIITVCFTGEGVAEQLKRIIKDRISVTDIEVVCLNILEKQEFFKSFHYYDAKNKIVAIVGTMDIAVLGIPFIPAMEILEGSGIERVESILREEDTYIRIKDSLKEHLDNINGESIVEDVRKTIGEIEKGIGKVLNEEAKTGVVLHSCFMIDKIKGEGRFAKFDGLKIFSKKYMKEMKVAKKAVLFLENKYGVEVKENELAYLCKMIISN